MRIILDRIRRIGYGFSKSFAEQLDDFLHDKFPERDTFIIGPTPGTLLKIGLASLPVTMDRTYVSYVLKGIYSGSVD